ncbi:MAG: carbon starvation protein A [Armatimonadota bacterium]|nr:carbon starvation protein A [Armatimonadota bacterium]
MNTLGLIAISLCVLALAYRYYAAFIAAKVLMLDPDRPTPAYQFRDGRDYHPTNKLVLFGHHFAAIAGAGPLIGPVLASQYGWGPGALWILVGAVFAGAVQDIIILWASVRQKGESLGQIARNQVSRVSGWATAFSILFIMVVALAGLAVVVVNALKGSAWGAFTIAGTIPIAFMMGQWMYKWRPGDVKGASIAGVILLFVALFGGNWIHHSQFASLFSYSDKAWCIILPVYGFIAAVLPVWMLLCPRDYLSTYMKLGVVALLGIGVILVHPEMKMPMTTQYLSGGGPIFPGPVWPYVSLIIMCGAISGFHALIASGTTPKMISSEREIPAISYGAMLVEAFVAILALIAACSLNPGDYFHINIDPVKYSAAKEYSATALAAQFPQVPAAQGVSELGKMVGEDVGGRPGGGVTLAVGMAAIFSQLPFMGSLMAFWYHFAIVFEALFILTTIDTGTRVARFILQELLGAIYKPLGRTNWLPGIIGTSALISICWGWLIYNNGISIIWPMFGVANQLLGVLSLAIGTTLLLRYATKRQYALVPFLPLCFLTVTVLYAGVLNLRGYLNPPAGKPAQTVPAVLTAAMLILVAVVIVDSVIQWARLIRSTQPVPRPVLGRDITAEATAPV